MANLPEHLAFGNAFIDLAQKHGCAMNEVDPKKFSSIDDAELKRFWDSPNLNPYIIHFSHKKDEHGLKSDKGFIGRNNQLVFAYQTGHFEEEVSEIALVVSPRHEVYVVRGRDKPEFRHEKYPMDIRYKNHILVNDLSGMHFTRALIDLGSLKTRGKVGDNDGIIKPARYELGLTDETFSDPEKARVLVKEIEAHFLHQ